MQFSKFLLKVYVFISLSFALFIRIQAASNAAATKFCPTFCYCDLFNGLNRADCSSQRLISPNVEVPPAVEILDISYNDITILDNNCFQSFVFLKNLTISHNGIHTIYLDAFSPLHSVTNIDLSHNRLEYMDERIFETNRKLETLNLSANKFMSLQNKPLLRSLSLQTLNLRNSQITYIYVDLFLALPNLHSLDVSQNLMITLNMAAFSALQRLQYLNLSKNRWNCDRGLLKPVELLRKRGMQVDLMDCDGIELRKEVNMMTAKEAKDNGITNAQSTKMFERMQMFDARHDNVDTSLEEKTEHNRLKEQQPKHNDMRKNIEHIWRRYEDLNVEPQQDHYAPDAEQCDESWNKLCYKYRRCLNNMSLLLLDKVSGENTMRGVYTWNDMNFIFVMGVALGIALVVAIISCAMCVKRCCESRTKREIIEYHIPVATVTHSPPQPPQRPPPSSQPQRTRISRRRAPYPPNMQSNALVRHDYATLQGRDNFLSRLFGRPARHQYYRTINQNTATLIRRLSRSNLFNNRLSQHYAAESRGEREARGDSTSSNSNSNNNNNNNNETPAVASSPSDERFYDDVFMGTEAVETPAPAARSTVRPETPPPAYGEVVINLRK